VRCILESLALAHAESVDLLEQVTGVGLAQLHIVGGGSRNELLCEWTANAAGRPSCARSAESVVSLQAKPCGSGRETSSMASMSAASQSRSP